jgi:hypothetical protein
MYIFVFTLVNSTYLLAIFHQDQFNNFPIDKIFSGHIVHSVNNYCYCTTFGSNYYNNLYSHGSNTPLTKITVGT